MGKIFLIRHGQASFGSADYDRLSSTGEEQARLLGLHLKGRQIVPTHVVSGTLLRHRQTAAACLGVLAGGDLHHEPQLDEGWNEFDGEELLVKHEPRYADKAEIAKDLARAASVGTALREVFGLAVGRWVSGQYDADYAEPWPAFGARCQAAFARAVAATPKDGTTLVFSSGGVIGTLAGTLLGLPAERSFLLQWHIVNASLTRVHVGRGGPALSTLNEHQHLEHEARLVTAR